jgi:PiT family inorganic phosphate transporter
VQKKENILDSLHVCSGATVSFARGLNDAPKIFSILLLSTSLSPIYGIIGILVFMIIWWVFLSKWIAKTMSKEITTMTHKQWFIGNFVTAIIVLFASKIWLPVSTTHMSVSSMFGIGIISSGARIKKIIEIILSWVLTLPVAFICSYIIFQIFSWYFG